MYMEQSCWMQWDKMSWPDTNGVYQNQTVLSITEVNETEIQFYYEVFVAWHSTILEGA